MNTPTPDHLRQEDAAAKHDKWFKAQVELAVKEADAPDADWISAAEAQSSWEHKRADLIKRAGNKS